jgi:hypothetical protein
MTIEDGGRHIEGVQARCADTINGVASKKKTRRGHSGTHQLIRRSEWSACMKNGYRVSPIDSQGYLGHEQLNCSILNTRLSRDP